MCGSSWMCSPFRILASLCIFVLHESFGMDKSKIRCWEDKQDVKSAIAITTLPYDNKTYKNWWISLHTDQYAHSGTDLPSWLTSSEYQHQTLIWEIISRSKSIRTYWSADTTIMYPMIADLMSRSGRCDVLHPKQQHNRTLPSSSSNVTIFDHIIVRRCVACHPSIRVLVVMHLQKFEMLLQCWSSSSAALTLLLVHRGWLWFIGVRVSLVSLWDLYEGHFRIDPQRTQDCQICSSLGWDDGLHSLTPGDLFETFSQHFNVR